jgi:nucleoside phosphorylase
VSSDPTPLVVAAVAEELGDLHGAALGVGPIAAGVRAAALLAERRPSSVLLVGTAGRYPGGPPIGAVVAGGRLGWADGSAALGLAYVPRPPDPLVGTPIAGLATASVLTVAAITTDVGLAARLGDRWEVEHLETFAVARACADARVPFAVVLGITNDVGPDAHGEWLAHRAEVQRAVIAAVRPAIG